jgi:predicted MFS family arabinose efflux permease
VLVATARYVRESRDPQPRRIDWLGQGVLSGGLFLLVLALLQGNDTGWGSTQIVAELSGAIALLGLFGLVERRVKDPMLPLGLFRVPAFAGAQISAFAISASLFAVYLYATLYFQHVLGLSAIEAGLVYVPGTILNAVVSGMTANLAEKVSARVMVSGGLALVSAGLLLMTGAGVHSSWTALLPGLLIAMIGTGMFNPAVIAVALGSVPENQSGLAAGVNDTFRQAGIAVGVAALGAMIPTGALATGDFAGYVGGLQNALVVGAAVAGIGALAAAYLIRPARKARQVSAGPVAAEAGC